MIKIKIFATMALLSGIVGAFTVKENPPSFVYYYLNSNNQCKSLIFAEDPCPRPPTTYDCKVEIVGNIEQLYTDQFCTNKAKRNFE